MHTKVSTSPWCGLIRAVLAACFLLAGPCHAKEATGTYVVITIDVCWICGEDFQGTWNGKDYGVPLIVEMLEARGFKGSFFVTPYCPDGMEEKRASNLKFLISRGHDIQFHAHPDVTDQSRQYLNMYSVAERRQMFAKGIKILQDAGAPRPVAHRAGDFSIDEATLRLLPEFGIHVDSSIYPRYSQSKVALPWDLVNRFAKIGGVYQLPIFLIRQLPDFGYLGTTALGLDRTTWWQQKIALEQAAEHKVPFVNVFLHFWSLYHRAQPEKPFEPLKNFGPNLNKIRALENILRILETDGRFKVVTVRQLWDIHESDPTALQGPSFIPYPGILPTYFKCCEHFFVGGVGNQIAVLSPPILIGLLVLVWVLWRRTRQSSKRRGSAGEVLER